MAKSVHRELTVPADTRCLSKVRDAVIEVIGGCAFSPVKANLIALAVDEAVANIMEHAFSNENKNGPGTKPADEEIQIILDANPARFEVIIRDRGTSFDPRTVPDADVQEHVKAGRKGGLGIFLMRRIMDEINYTYKQGEQNELLMIKYIDESARKPKTG